MCATVADCMRSSTQSPKYCESGRNGKEFCGLERPGSSDPCDIPKVSYPRYPWPRRNGSSTVGSVLQWTRQDRSILCDANRCRYLPRVMTNPRRKRFDLRHYDSDKLVQFQTLPIQSLRWRHQDDRWNWTRPTTSRQIGPEDPSQGRMRDYQIPPCQQIYRHMTHMTGIWLWYCRISQFEEIPRTYLKVVKWIIPIQYRYGSNITKQLIVSPRFHRDLSEKDRNSIHFSRMASE